MPVNLFASNRYMLAKQKSGNHRQVFDQKPFRLFQHRHPLRDRSLTLQAGVEQGVEAGGRIVAVVVAVAAAAISETTWVAR